MILYLIPFTSSGFNVSYNTKLGDNEIICNEGEGKCSLGLSFTLPSQINNIKIGIISSHLFLNNTNIVNITIPSSYHTILNRA